MSTHTAFFLPRTHTVNTRAFGWWAHQFFNLHCSYDSNYHLSLLSHSVIQIGHTGWIACYCSNYTQWLLFSSHHSPAHCQFFFSPALHSSLSYCFSATLMYSLHGIVFQAAIVNGCLLGGLLPLGLGFIVYNCLLAFKENHHRFNIKSRSVSLRGCLHLPFSRAETFYYFTCSIYIIAILSARFILKVVNVRKVGLKKPFWIKNQSALTRIRFIAK